MATLLLDMFSIAKQMRLATRCRVFRSQRDALKREVEKLKAEVKALKKT